MSQLYPFLLIPIFDERPWGGRDLRPVYTRVVKEPIGESWLTWEDNRVANGPLAGQSLGDLAKKFGRDLVGRLRVYENRFPLLVKFLFPGDKLSVQVHPDDEQARKNGQPCGKTECWYVLRAEPGAQVALGLKPGVTLDEFRAGHRGDARRRAAELGRCLRRRHALRRRGHGAHHRRRHGAGRDAADLGHHVSPVRLRPRRANCTSKKDWPQPSCTPMRVRWCATAPARTYLPNVLVRSPFFQVEKMQLAGA